MPPKDPTIEEAKAFRGRARPASRDTGPPMTLGNMRENGVRGLFVYCLSCHHSVEFNVDHMPDAVEVTVDRPAHGVLALRAGRRRRAAELERVERVRQNVTGIDNGRGRRAYRNAR